MTMHFDHADSSKLLFGPFWAHLFPPITCRQFLNILHPASQNLDELALKPTEEGVSNLIPAAVSENGTILVARGVGSGAVGRSASKMKIKLVGRKAIIR